MDKLFMSIFVYYDVIVIVAFFYHLSLFAIFAIMCICLCGSSLHQKQMNLPTP